MICTFFVPISRRINFSMTRSNSIELDMRFELVRIFAALHVFVNCMHMRPQVSHLSRPPISSWSYGQPLA